MRVVARFDVFEDSVAAAKFPGSRIGTSAWVDPACADVRAYVLGEVKDLVARTVIAEINFDHVRYPQPADVGGGAGTRLPCTGSTLGDVAHADRAAIVASWVANAVAAAHAVHPWVEGFGPYETRPDIIGQELKAVSDARGSGALVWWFASTGTSASFWRTVAADAW
jgi:hypothetical protein